MKTVQQTRRKPAHYEIQGHLRYLTFSCFGRLPLFGNPDIRDAFASDLAHVCKRGAFRLHAWVVMPEHVHLLITPNLPEWTVPKILTAIKRPFSRRVLARWRELGAPILIRVTDDDGAARFWLRGGGYDRNVFSKKEAIEKIEYIHANPVRRGLVGSPDEWRWSSASWYEEHGSGMIAIDPIEF